MYIYHIQGKTHKVNLNMCHLHLKYCMIWYTSTLVLHINCMKYIYINIAWFWIFYCRYSCSSKVRRLKMTTHIWVGLPDVVSDLKKLTIKESNIYISNILKWFLSWIYPLELRFVICFSQYENKYTSVKSSTFTRYCC